MDDQTGSARPRAPQPGTAPKPQPAPLLRRALRDPLTHFLGAGALLFAA